MKKAAIAGVGADGSIYEWRASFRTIAYARVIKTLQVYQGKRFLFLGFMRFLTSIALWLKPKKTISIRIHELDFLLNPQDDVMTPQILVHRTYEPKETSLIQRAVKPGMNFIDLGANIGYFTLLASRCVGSEGKVYAFEPEDLNYQYLTENIRRNNAQNVRAIRKAVLNHPGTVSLFLDKGNLGAHTISKQNIETAYHRTVQVDAVTFDDFFENENIKVDFVKMDLQGAEGLVLEKAVRMIRRFPMKILMEFWPLGLTRAGTDPRNLLTFLDQYFSIQIVGDPAENRTPSEILQITASSYVNLFLQKKHG